MLSSRECRTCGEEHLVQRNGLMSIHTNARGERCEEQPHKLPATLPGKVLRERRIAEQKAERRAAKQAAQKRVRDPLPLLAASEDELEAAFEFANRDRRQKARQSAPMDRRIYAVPGTISVTSGGLPGTARSH